MGRSAIVYICIMWNKHTSPRIRDVPAVLSIILSAHFAKHNRSCVVVRINVKYYTVVGRPLIKFFEILEWHRPE